MGCAQGYPIDLLGQRVARHRGLGGHELRIGLGGEWAGGQLLLAFVSYLSAAALAAFVLRETVGEEISSDVAIAPVACLRPYVLVSIGTS